MFDRDLIIEYVNPVHHQTQDALLGFKVRIVERVGDTTTKLFHRRAQRGLLLL